MKKFYSIIVLLSLVFVSCGKKEKEKLNQVPEPITKVEISNAKKIQHTIGYFELNDTDIKMDSENHEYISVPVVNFDANFKNETKKTAKSMDFKIIDLELNEYGKTVLSEGDRLSLLDISKNEEVLVTGDLSSGSSKKTNISLMIWPSKSENMSDNVFQALKNKMLNFDYYTNYFDKKISKATVGEIDSISKFDIKTVACLKNISISMEITYEDGTKSTQSQIINLGDLVYQFLEINELDLTRTGEDRYVDVGILKTSQTDGENLIITNAMGNYSLAGKFEGENVYLMFTDKDINVDRENSKEQIIVKEDGTMITKPLSKSKSVSLNSNSVTDIGRKLEERVTNKLTKTQIDVNRLSKTILANRAASLNQVATVKDEERTFKVSKNDNTITQGPEEDVIITAKAYAVNIDGNRQINVWVNKDDINSGKITRQIAQDFADKFMKPNSKEDIYSWVTNIFGKEWLEKGENFAYQKYSGINQISGNGEIDILLTELNKTYVNEEIYGGSTVGYFWQVNTLKSTSSAALSDKAFIDKYSNERNMFLVDSTWASKPEKRTMIYSTLAHEFVHMINWFQKDLLKGASTVSWLNETFAMIGEDLLDDKLGDKGSKDRANQFIEMNYMDVNDKDDKYTIVDYPVNSIYGTYLTRTYVRNDLSFIRNMMHNEYGAEDAIEYAIRKQSLSAEPETYLQTIKNFGKAAILSNNDTIVRGTKYWMNKPAFSVYEGGVEYKFEPINLFDTELVGNSKFTLFGLNDTSAPLLKGGANLFYDLGNGSQLNGIKKFTFNIPEGVLFEVIVKNADGSYNKEKSEALQKVIKPVIN